MVALCASATSITEVGGWLETGWVTFTLDSDASSYNVYCKASGGDYTLLDSPLVRNYGDYGRADALGLAEGTYQFKVVPVDSDGNELTSAAAESSTFTVNAKDRTGFAFSNGYVPGAYKSDGTLKSDALVVYITDNNKDAVTVDVVTSAKKGTVTTEVGLDNILLGFKKGEDSRPLCIRLIGQISIPSVNEKGDIVIDMNSSETCPGITIEGVGNDATCDGWGIRLKNAISVEVANLGFMNCASEEGDNVGLQQNNSYVWVHNCDMFYGEAGSDSDQKKGDGALDCKKSNYVTFSYNHFWDNGKCCLLGLSEKSYDYYITYHHNW
ncbi:MAG: pectate lyase, partial [Prevotella sp.]|nr:pectate lyase [Prevotella sp.]